MSTNQTEMTTEENFWLEEPIVLFRTTTIIPNPYMSYHGKLNALTRLILLITLFLYLFCVSRWWFFLLVGLLFVIILYYLQPYPSSYNKSRNVVENYICSERREKMENSNEKFFPSRHKSGFKPY
mgnify:CR=1 FL=1